MTVLINPGSEPVPGATRANAALNIEVFCLDLVRFSGADQAFVPPGNFSVDLDNGRWEFLLATTYGRQHRTFEVAMPGLKLSRVRYLEPTGLPEFTGQSISEFPRLYIDGDSYVWYFALLACRPDIE